jgi:hypothetical protein
VFEFLAQTALVLSLPVGRFIYRRLPAEMQDYIEPDSGLGMMLAVIVGAIVISLTIAAVHAVGFKLFQ